MELKKVSIKVQDQSVSGVLLQPSGAQALLVLGHGAGAGMLHPFMEQLASDLAQRQIATLRYNFPYMEAGRKSPNAPSLSQATVRAAAEKAAALIPGVPLLAGGKSYGGRMSSQSQADKPLPMIKGLVFFGFPLHAPGKPGDKRGEHLKKIKIPMLFLQGSRDKLAALSLMEPLCRSLGRVATLEILEGADHGFSTLKSSDKSTAETRQYLAEATSKWLQKTSGTF